MNKEDTFDLESEEEDLNTESGEEDAIEDPAPARKKITRSEFGKAIVTRRASLILAALILIGALITYAPVLFGPTVYQEITGFFALFTDKDFLLFALIGFTAQMIDGALGMAYGASSMTMLTSAGVSSSIANSCIKLAEVFTTSASGISHWRMGNINKKLVKNLIIPGVIGAAAGASLIAYVDHLTEVKSSRDIVKYIISVYILLLGVYILYKALRKPVKKKKTKRLNLLAGFGGFMDAAGGGGWGPIVTSTLISKGRNPRYTIGSVNLSEFFIALTSGVIITLVIGLEEWRLEGGLKVVLGLIIGGVIAAPFGAVVAKKVKAKPMMIVVGTLIILVNLEKIIKMTLKYLS